MFTHIEVDYPTLSRQTIDGVRYYDTPNGSTSIRNVIQAGKTYLE